MDNARNIKSEVQRDGRYVARLLSRHALKTVNALRADGYGVRLIVKNIEGFDLWSVTGEPEDKQTEKIHQQTNWSAP